ERDDGRVDGVSNPDSLQKKIKKECERIYPAINWRSQVYEKSGQHCIRIEIRYSGQTPHFGGPAWVRSGSVTVKASEETFQRLVEYGLSTVRELRKATRDCGIGSSRWPRASARPT